MIKTLFGRISKHLDFRQKYSLTRRISNAFLDVWRCGHIQSFVFDMIHLNNHN